MRAYYENKVAAITGAASGIGLAVTELLLENGATAFMADINGDTLRDQVARLDKAFPNKAIGVQTDVTKRSQVKALIDQAAKFDGHLDFLFNNAGIGATLPFEQVTMEFWKRAIDINLWGVIYGIDAALPIMRRQQSGHIINTSSLAGYIPPPFQAVYSATKYAVTGMTQCLRYEVWDEHVRFSTVCPGNVATAIFAAAGALPDDAVPVEEAARIILEGVANNENLIIFPEATKQYLHGLSPEEMEQFLIRMSRERHENYRTKGNYF